MDVPILFWPRRFSAQDRIVFLHESLQRRFSFFRRDQIVQSVYTGASSFSHKNRQYRNEERVWYVRCRTLPDFPNLQLSVCIPTQGNFAK